MTDRNDDEIDFEEFDVPRGQEGAPEIPQMTPLAPPAVGLAVAHRQPALDHEEQALRGGKGGMIAVMVGAGALAIGALVFAMSGDDSEAYEQFGRNVNGLEGAHFEGFWGCVFQGAETIKDDQALRAQIHKRAGRGKDRFGAHVDTRCMPELAELETQLQTLLPPNDLGPLLLEEIQAVRALRSGWSDYTAYLQGLDMPYRPADAKDHVGRIAKAWYNFRKAHSALNRLLRERLAS